MATVYSIQNLDDGTYWYRGDWAEEPEWFSMSQVNKILATDMRKQSCETQVSPHRLESEDME